MAQAQLSERMWKFETRSVNSKCGTCTAVGTGHTFKPTVCILNVAQAQLSERDAQLAANAARIAELESAPMSAATEIDSTDAAGVTCGGWERVEVWTRASCQHTRF